MPDISELHKLTGAEIADRLQSDREAFLNFIVQLVLTYLLQERKSLKSTVILNMGLDGDVRAFSAMSEIVRSLMLGQSPKTALEKNHPEYLDQQIVVDSALMNRQDPLALIRQLIDQVSQQQQALDPQLAQLFLEFAAVVDNKTQDVKSVQQVAAIETLPTSENELAASSASEELTDIEVTWLKRHHHYKTHERVTVISLKSIFQQLEEHMGENNASDFQHLFTKFEVRRYSYRELDLKNDLPLPAKNAKFISIPDVLQIIRSPEIQRKLKK